MDLLAACGAILLAVVLMIYFLLKHYPLLGAGQKSMQQGAL